MAKNSTRQLHAAISFSIRIYMEKKRNDIYQVQVNIYIYFVLQTDKNKKQKAK